ncbi:MAG: alpha-pyrone synthase [Sphingobacteriales bacterium]|jgi:alpha-pyrone synthase
MAKSKLISISTATPMFGHRQKDIETFMSRRAPQEPDRLKKIADLYANSGINNRHSVLKDFSEEGDFFLENDEINIDARMKKYQSEAPILAKEVAENCINSGIKKESITHVITLSCTGMMAPGLDFYLVQDLGLSINVERTNINFMGCFAMFNALKVADNIARANENAVILIVGVELCTLHFRNDDIPQQYLANALFADGAASGIVVNENNPLGKKSGFLLDSFFSSIVPNSEEVMSWKISNNGFLMNLSPRVPVLLGRHLKAGVDALLSKSNEITKIEHYAPHPGGVSVLKAFSEALDIEIGELENSFEVLKNNGNMSSVTVFFVLSKLLKKLTEKNHNESILTVAFGPGLTLETALLKYQHA